MECKQTLWHTQSKNYLVVPICLKNMLVKLKHLFLTSETTNPNTFQNHLASWSLKNSRLSKLTVIQPPYLKHNMVVIKMEHHQISMDMNGLVEVIESQELGRQRMTLPTTTKRHSPPTVVLLISWYLETFETEVFYQKLKSHHLSHLEVGSHHVHHRLGASRSTVTMWFSSSFSTLPALLMLVERRAATWAANQVFLCCFDEMKDSSYVRITTTDWKTGKMEATNKSPQKNCKYTNTHIHLLCLILSSTGQWYWRQTMFGEKNLSNCPGKAFPLDRTVCIIHKCLP